MVQTTNTNLRIIKKFKQKLKKLKIEKIVFFGSRANGKFNKESDFDILAISDKFEGVKWNERPLEIYLNWKESLPLEVICLTPKEFEDKKKHSSFLRQISKEGIEI
jgi:predicted nucleotidyltransferase